MRISYWSSDVCSSDLDSLQRPTSVTIAAGNGSVSSTTGYAYDTKNNLISVDGPLSGAADTITYRYDALQRRVGEIGPDPDGPGPRKRQAVRTTYDTLGRATLVEVGTVKIGRASCRERGCQSV